MVPVTNMMTEDMIDDASEEALGNYLYSLRKGRGCVFWGQINIGDRDLADTCR